MKDIKKTKDSNRTSRCEKYIFDEKYCGIQDILNMAEETIS